MKTQLQTICKNLKKVTSYSVVASTLILSTTVCAFSDNNSYFGANASGSGTSSSGTDYSKDLPEDSNPNAVLPGLNDTAMGTPKPNGTDFTGDEKRMQKKYKSNIAHANSLINRGAQMMKSSENNHSSSVYKKGKIFKEIGEKRLAELKANNPFTVQKQ